MNDARLQVAFGGMHPDRIRDLYDSYGPGGTLRRIVGGGIKTTPRVRAAVGVPADQRREQLSAAGIDVVYKGGDAYPNHLGELPDAPDLLFVRGELPSQLGVAVVGTRRCTSYGRSIARDYGTAIARCGWPLVSGLARGIDGCAHRGTVDGAGVGIAVLGSGIDVMYPQEHRDLARDLIASGGAVASESPPGTPPEAWRFPPRNRVISGLAAAVVVVEATVKGGALITAEAALRHGKQVFALPGDITRASSVGCNLLIRDGAFPVLDSDDLVESLELLMGPAPRPPVNSDAAGGQAGDRELLELIASGVGDFDEIMTQIDAAPGEVLAALGRLEAGGVVRCDVPGRYSVSGRTVSGR
ncbi:MAG: DNA-processing protein DprA [Acidimicrobiia bacterium]|nr:DNA-processing protein DprA [Acidimicrobiia bacterium]